MAKRHAMVSALEAHLGFGKCCGETSRYTMAGHEAALYWLTSHLDLALRELTVLRGKVQKLERMKLTPRGRVCLKS
jgi:hypothetical protein